MSDWRFKTVVLMLLSCLWVADTAAQEITPRLFWPTPKGTKVLITGFAHATGDVLFDPATTIENADATVNSGLLGYVQTFDLWGRTANLLVSQPYYHGHMTGSLDGSEEATDFSAFGDFSATLNINLKGAPTMDREQFAAFRADPKPLLGASLKVIAPTGQYDPGRLINVGSNRWTARFKLGSAWIIERSWVLELAASAWFFTDDPDFVNGRMEQSPLFTLEGNLIKRIRPGLWASLDVTYYRGGRQTVDGVELNNWQSNLKVGGTLVVPFLKRHAIKIGYANGVVIRYGDDFNQWLVSYQYAIR
jgi:hypothetical protein